MFITGGIGLVFGGLAALTTAFLLYLNILDSNATLLQMAIALGLTTLFGAILWKPLKKWRLNPELENRITNLIGDSVTVTEGALEKGKTGKVKWSGTIMNAELDANAEIDRLEDGAPAIITAKDGTTVTVAPKN